MTANLAEQLGQPCTRTWAGTTQQMSPASQTDAAKNSVVGMGFAVVRNTKFSFPIICLKGVFVAHPDYVHTLLTNVRPWMSVPIPWATQVNPINFEWCGPAYACSDGPNASGCYGNGKQPVNRLYSANQSQLGPCLSQYDLSQPRGSLTCWDVSNGTWKTFWLAVGDAVRRMNLGERPLQ